MLIYPYGWKVSNSHCQKDSLLLIPLPHYQFDQLASILKFLEYHDFGLQYLVIEPTVMFIIFWKCLMFGQIFLSTQVKRSVINSNRLVHMSCLRIWPMHSDLGYNFNEEVSGKSQNFIELLSSAQSSSRTKNFINASKNLLKNRKWTYLKYFVNDVPLNCLFLLNHPRPLQIWCSWQFS